MIGFCLGGKIIGKFCGMVVGAIVGYIAPNYIKWYYCRLVFGALLIVSILDAMVRALF